MDADVAALLVDVVASGEIALLAVGGSGRGLVSADLLVGVIDEILLVRHVVDFKGDLVRKNASQSRRCPR